MRKLLLTLSLLGMFHVKQCHATSPYYSLSMSTTTGITSMTITGNFEMRQATSTTVKVFRVDRNGHVQAYGGLEVSTSPTASPLLWVSSTVPRVGIATTTPRNTLDVNGGIIATSSVTASDLFASGSVAIGTDTTTQKLYVQQTGGDMQTTFENVGTGGGDHSYLAIKASGTSVEGINFYHAGSQKWELRSDVNSLNDFRIFNSSKEVMNFRQNGDIAITSGSFMVNGSVLLGRDGFNVAIGTNTTFTSRRLAVVQHGANAVQTILTDPTRISALVFGDTDDDDIGGMIYNHSGDILSLRTNTVAQFNIDESALTSRLSTIAGRSLYLRTPGLGDLTISADDGGAFSVSSITFKTSGINRMKILNDGNLELEKTSGSLFSTIRNTGTGGGNHAYVKIDSSGTSISGIILSQKGVSKWEIRDDVNSADDLRFFNAGAEVLNLRQNGDIFFSSFTATGGAVCINSSKKVSKCTSVVDASGNCTCP